MSPPRVTNVDSISLRIGRHPPRRRSDVPVPSQGPAEQRVELGERALPASGRVVAERLMERALTQLEPCLAARLGVELQPHVEPDRARRAGNPLDLLVPNQQLVLDDFGEGEVDGAAI